MEDDYIAIIGLFRLFYQTTMRFSGARYILSPGLVEKASWNAVTFLSA